MKILITGGAGFIGSNVTKNLLANNHEVICFDNFSSYYSPKIKKRNIQEFLKDKKYKFYRGDITNRLALEKVFKKEKINRVLHLASMPSVRESLNSPADFGDVNIGGTINLLELSRKYGVENFVYASSSVVYGNNKIPFKESMKIDSPMSPYAVFCRSCELLGYFYHKTYGLNVNIVRLSNVYGPGSRPDLLHFIICKSIIEGREIKKFNQGLSKRDFVYIDDLVQGIVSAISKKFGYQIFNLGGGVALSINEIIKMFEKVLKKKAIVKDYPAQNGDVQFIFSDSKKAYSSLDYSIDTSMNIGIRKFVDWFVVNYKKYE